MNEEYYRAHLDLLIDEWSKLLARNRYDAAIIAAGENSFFYADDQSPPFHANPHFLRWTVYEECEHCALVLRLGKEPQLHWYTPQDYWYLPSSLPDWLATNFDHQVHATTSELNNACELALKGLHRIAYVGPEASVHLKHQNVEIASTQLMDQLAYYRAYKTPFEICSMSVATSVGVRGHIAARESFFSGASEFDIHAAYLAASRQSFHNLPYPSIVGVNEHASTLHYQHYEDKPPTKSRSLLIDAGGKHQCYHSDITRTYSRIRGIEFDTLISTVDEFQQRLIGELDTFQDFVELHERTHRLVAEALVEHELIRCEAASAYEQQLTDVFYPHGTGHLLGLQTHDLGGHIANEEGFISNPPDRFPSLRLTRKIEPTMVFTIEPGIYFIPVLLAPIAGHKDINWSKVEDLLPFGGVRIEDNVVVVEGGIRNLTREAFQDIDSLQAT